MPLPESHKPRSIGVDLILPDVSGDEKQAAAIAKLCQDCRGLLQRVSDLISGKAEPVKRRTYYHKDSEERLESDSSFQDTAPFEKMREDNSMPHKSLREDLQISSDQGCVMCMWFLQSFQSRQEDTNSHNGEQWLKRPASVETMWQYSPLGHRCREHYYLTVRSPAPLPRPPSEIPPETRERRTRKELRQLEQGAASRPRPNAQLRGDEAATLIVDVIPNSIHAEDLLLATKNLEHVTPSTSTWKLISTWLQICVEDHPTCKHDISKEGARQEMLPTRLLDIRAMDVVRLVETEQIGRKEEYGHLKYAALSHCWGTTHDPQLNSCTMGDLTKGIPTHDFPKLFQDAIFLARLVGMPYLWIDSLCIIQDSKPDWNRESVKMGAIYKHSFICIAATAAPDNNGSLLEEHKVGWPRPLVYGNLLVHGDVGKEPTSLYELETGWCARMRFMSQWAVDTAPLNQRSWVLQERTLAPRILHCTSDEFVWECRAGMRSESHLHLTTGGSAVKDFSNALSETPSHLRKPSGLHLHIKERKPYLERWSQLISVYSRTSISFIDDRLPACSALAQQMQPILGKYVAGLWVEYLPSQLLWYHNPYGGPVRRSKEQQIRRGNCPSWSWASLDRSVTLPFYYRAKHREDFPSQNRVSGQMIDFSEVPLIQISKIDMDLSGNDSTGAVNSGRMNVDGHIFPVYWSRPFGYLLNTDAPSHNPGPSILWHFDDVDIHQPNGDVEKKREALEPVNDTERMILYYGSVEQVMLRHNKLVAIHAPVLTKLHCLPILCQKHPTRGNKDDYRVYGLVLEKNEGIDASHRRVGIFSWQKGLLENATKSTFDLQATSFKDKLTIC